MKVAITLLACCLISISTVYSAPGDEVWDYHEVRPGAHMFWWLMYSRHQGAPETRPLVIWLTGGPGGSSTGWGNFEEVGPLDWNLQPRNITWLDHSHLLFIDSPVGAGYSYVETPNLYVTTNYEIAQDLVTLIKHFLMNVAPELAASPVIIVGESYGGKMGPEFMLELHKANTAGELDINLQGVVIRDGWTSPVDGMLSYPQYCLQMSLVDQEGFDSLEDLTLQSESAINEARWTDASDLFDATMLEIDRLTFGVDVFFILSPLPPKYSRNTQLPTKDRLLRKRNNNNSDILDLETLDALMNGPIYDKLSQTVPGLAVWGLQRTNVLTYLWEDFMKPVIHIVEEILNTTDIQVAVVNGQLDLIVDTDGAMRWINRLSWPGAGAWHASPRDPLVINDITEGYLKKSGQFSMRWVNRAGHSVFYFNPQAGLEMLQDLTGLL